MGRMLNAMLLLLVGWLGYHEQCVAPRSRSGELKQIPVAETDSRTTQRDAWELRR